MTWLLVVFLPGHTRGAITFNRDNGSDSCCAPTATQSAERSCCTNGSEHPNPSEPTRKDRQGCAVCCWAAGLIAAIPFVFENDHAERAFLAARQFHAQIRRIPSRLNYYGRDPPTVGDDRLV